MKGYATERSPVTHAQQTLQTNPSILREGATLVHVGAAALPLALAGSVLLLLGASHPPAGATVSIASLGLLKTPAELAMIVVGVANLTVAGWVVNRAFGTPMPPWSRQGWTVCHLLPLRGRPRACRGVPLRGGAPVGRPRCGDGPGHAP